MMSKILLSGTLLVFVLQGLGQNKWKLSISPDISMPYKTVHLDSANLLREVKKYHITLQSKGYIASYINSCEKESDLFSYSFVLGDLYTWERVVFSSSFKNISGNLAPFEAETYNERTIDNRIQDVLIKCQNSGYPFAQVFFDSVLLNKGRISANVELRLNDFIVIDSIIIKGGMKTSLNYIKKQIGFQKGSVYNEFKINEINKKITNIDFVELIRDVEVYFTKGKATLVLYLKDKTASKFDGILGLNSDEITGKITGKIGIVGDLKVDLWNSFKRGENIVLNWRQVKTESQDYLINFSYPFLFNTRIGLEAGLNYFRQDTTFANLDTDFGFSFFLDDKQKVGVSVQFIESNSLLNSQSALIGLPATNSVNTLYYGVSFLRNSLDYKINPRRGWMIEAVLKTGVKTIKKNLDLENVNYKILEEKSTQIKTDVSISYFIPLFKKSTVLLKVQSGNIFGDNIFLNELYQIGGLKTIRGFNQQSILASNYYITTSEFRHLFDVNSSVFCYVDYAYYQKKSTASFEVDTLFGFGFGANFQTKAGVFSLSYGLGKQMRNPILIKNGKVHFGFVSLF